MYKICSFVDMFWGYVHFYLHFVHVLRFMRTLVDITFLYNLFTFLYKMPRSGIFVYFALLFLTFFPFGKLFYLVPIGCNCVVVLIPVGISFVCVV